MDRRLPLGEPGVGGVMSPDNGMKRLVREAHRRSLWQVMILYLGASWAVLEAADHVIQRFEMPDWAYGTAVLLLLIGFPIVMATAIVQEGVRGRDGPGSREARAKAGPSAGGSSAGSGEAPGSLDALETLDSAASPTTGGLSAIRPATGEPGTVHRLFTWRNAVLGGVAAFGLWGVIATGLLLSTNDQRSAVGGTDDRRDDGLKAIAVLPFDNLSADADNAYFADGIHEDVLTQLSKIADLTVISRTSVLPYRTTEKSLRQIADELGVGSILEGSVRRAGDNVRITAQLIDAETDQHLWADNFDRGLTAASVFAIQTEIARQIAEALRATLSPEEETRIAHVPTTDLTAYDLYIRGREAYQRYLTDDNEEAIRLFKEAISSDPGYAEPFAGLADAYDQRVQLFGYPIEWADSAEALARHAIDLDPRVATGYKALAFSMTMRGRERAALEAALEAIARDPNHYAAVNNAGFSYERLGQYDEAIRWYKRAARLNPLAFAALNKVTAYALLGEEDIARRAYAEAADVEAALFRRTNYGIMLELYTRDPSAALQRSNAGRAELWDVPVFLAFDAAARTAAGDLEGARESAERAFELSPGASLEIVFYDLQTRLGYAMMRTGDEAEGQALLADRAAAIRSHLAAGADRPGLFWELAAIHAALGEPEEAVRLATQAREAGFQPANGYLEIEPMMASVRDDPRIVAMFEESRREIEEQRRRVEAEEIQAGLR